MVCDYRRVVANWAIVVGIDRYWSEGAHLRGAVRDALAVREWLLDPAGGDVPGREPPARARARPEQPRGRPGARRARGHEGEHHRRDQRPDPAERRQGRAAVLLLRRPRAHDARLEPRRERAARDRLHERQHRPVDRAPLAVGVLRDDAVRGPVLLRRRVPQRAALGRGRRVRARPLDAPAHARPRRAAGAAVHPLRDLAEAEGDRGPRRARARSTAPSRPRSSTACAAPGRRRRGRGSGSATRCAGSGSPTTSRSASRTRPRKVGETPEGAQLQIPQDTGSRGVAGRERDALLTSFAGGHVRRRSGSRSCSTPTRAYPIADVRVLDALGDVVAGQVGVDRHVGRLLPAAGHVRAPGRGAGDRRGTRDRRRSSCTSRSDRAADDRAADRSRPGRAAAERARGTARAAAAEPPRRPRPPRAQPRRRAPPPGGFRSRRPTHSASSRCTDETGNVVEVGRAPEPSSSCRPASTSSATSARSDDLGADPRRTRAGRDREAGRSCRARSRRPRRSSCSRRWAGGRRRGRRSSWTGASRSRGPQTSTLVALALGRALTGEAGTAALDLAPPRPAEGVASSRGGVAVYVVSETERDRPRGARDPRLEGRRARAESHGEAAAGSAPRLAELVAWRASPAATGSRSIAAARGGRWCSPLTVLRDRMATIVVQITAGIRLFQYQPAIGRRPGDDAGDAAARRVPGAPAALRSARRRPRARARARRDGRPVRRLPVRVRPAPARAQWRS